MRKCLWFVCLFVLAVPGTLLTQEYPTVRAQVLSFDTVSEDYTAMRKAGVIAITVDGHRHAVVNYQSDEDGFVEFAVESKRPFSLVFHGGSERVPEMTELAGTLDGGNVLYVCLRTVSEYREHHPSVGYTKAWATRAVLRAVRDTAPEAVWPALDDLLAVLEEQLGRMG